MIVTPSILEKAIKIATTAHAGQTDKGGNPYISHPMRLMENVESVEEKIVAVLHDVVEDTEVSFADLEKEGIPQVCIDALLLLTHDKDVPYMDYVKSISSNEIATSVKIADLKDNSDLSRLESITEKDIARVEKYSKALSILQA